MTDDDLLDRIKDSMDWEELIDTLALKHSPHAIIDALAELIKDSREDFHNLTYGEY